MAVIAPLPTRARTGSALQMHNLTIPIQNEKLRLGAFYAIRPGNGVGLDYTPGPICTTTMVTGGYIGHMIKRSWVRLPVRLLSTGHYLDL